MIWRFFEILFSLTSLKQKKALWKVENRYRLEMSQLARRMRRDKPLSKKYDNEAKELLSIRNKLIEIIRDKPEKLTNDGEFK